MIERKPNFLALSLLEAIVAAICIVCGRMLNLPETCIPAAPKYTCCCFLEDTQFSCRFFIFYFFFHLGCLVFYGFRQITNVSNYRFRITGTSWEHHGKQWKGATSALLNKLTWGKNYCTKVVSISKARETKTYSSCLEAIFYSLFSG